MIKRTIRETVSEYDKDGNIVRQTVTETTEPAPICTIHRAISLVERWPDVSVQRKGSCRIEDWFYTNGGEL